MAFRFAAQIEQSLLKTASRDPKLAFIIAAVSAPQQILDVALMKGQATFRLLLAVVSVLEIGAGAK